MSILTHKKKIIPVILFFFFALVACSPEKNAPLSVSLDNMEVGADENAQFMRIATDDNIAWTITVTHGNEWCTVTPSQGIGTKSTVRVQISENNSIELRTVIIIVTAGNNTQTLELTQAKATYLDVSVNRTEVPNTACSLSLLIKAKTAWTASVTEGIDFCSLSSASGSGTATINALFAENNTDTRRIARVKISTVTDDVNISIIQIKAGEVIGGNRPEQTIPKRIELPEVKNRRWYVEHKIGEYAMEYDTAQRHSVWVAYVLNSRNLQQTVSRQNSFVEDPLIPYEFSSHQPDFSGYDRGHLIASGDRLASNEANRETFYYSNMSPQVGAFNQRIWANLETKVRKWAKECDTLYVVTGGAVNQGVATIRQGTGLVTVPKYYFKALVKRTGNSFTGIAFWMENKIYSNDNVTHEYSMTIRELEQKTGINFFPNLLNEDVIETSRDISKWVI